MGCTLLVSIPALIGLISNLLHGAVKHSDSSEQLRGHIKKTATRAVASLLMHKAAQTIVMI